MSPGTIVNRTSRRIDRFRAGRPRMKRDPSQFFEEGFQIGSHEASGHLLHHSYDLTSPLIGIGTSPLNVLHGFC